MILKLRTFSASDFDIVLRAQQGDMDAAGQVLRENINLIHSTLARRGISPRSIGYERYQDFVGDIQLHFLKDALANYNPSKGGLSTFITTVVDRRVTDMLQRPYKVEREASPEQEPVSMSNPLGTDDAEKTTVEDTIASPGIPADVKFKDDSSGISPGQSRETGQEQHIPVPDLDATDLNTSGINPYINIMIEHVKQNLSPFDRMVLDYKLLGYTISDISKIMTQEGVQTPRGGDTSSVQLINRHWNSIIKPQLEQVFPAEMRQPYEFTPSHTKYVKNLKPWPWAPAESPTYKLDPETGERIEVDPKTWDPIDESLAIPGSTTASLLSLDNLYTDSVLTFLQKSLGCTKKF